MATPPRHALVTGGASGFGLAIARALVAGGARVAVADVNAERLGKLQQAFAGPDALLLHLDVTSRASVRAGIELCERQWGGLDTLVNCAGVIQFARLDDITEQDWDRVVDVNLKGAFLCAQAAAPLLRSGGRGRIVNIGSDASKVGFPMLASYCASKFGLVGLTKALAGELAPYHVTVNCICPVGVSETEMGQEVLKWKMQATGKQSTEILQSTAAAIPLKRNARLNDIVNAALFFLLDESSFLTGVALDVDGGLLSTTPVPGAGGGM
jgi:meso-butanediol dehydrogenase/(S,S)-butanediol dehydrogenase/diacetyl reductase